ncbi:MAG: EF-hand domain-containing protein [Deltaproteobacteria bacterium]|nr:EF-hand domain-containing protein [Deltaproteobacteria bacterium]
MHPIAKLLTVLLVGATMLSSAASQALTPTHEQVRKSWENRFQARDKNRDGKVSLEEFLVFHGAELPLRQQLLEYEFRKYDRNGDGFITHEEHWAPVGLEDEFRGVDRNRDGRISPDEFLQGERLFRRLDRNNDGVITWDEYSDAYRPRRNRK